MPYASNSPETRGPTTSTRRYSTASPSAPRTFCTAACCAASPPGCSATLISTSAGPPNCCNCTSPRPRPLRVERIEAMSAAPDLDCTSSSVPPLKSMPKFNPWVKNSVIATIESAAEIGKLMRRKRVKSKCVLSGTIRSDGSRPSALTTVSTAMRTPSPMRTKCVTAGSAFSNRHALRPLPPHPGRHDQAGKRKRGENRGDDADAERHGEAAHRPGADIEQHRGGDEGGDIGIQDRRQRALETGVDRGNRVAPAAQFLADALIDQHVGVDRDADRQDDAGESVQRQAPPVRASMMVSGAGSARARSRIARSLAACTVKLPEICPEPAVIGSRITGAEITSLSSTMAKGCPTFSEVACANLREPEGLKRTLTIGSPVRWSKPGCASVKSAPETRTCFLMT